MTAIALTQDRNGQFEFTYANGAMVRESSELSFAKHNLFCFGRLNINLTINPLLRRGSIGSALENRELYSAAWLYYLEGNINFDAMQKIISEFNRACDRDFNAGLIAKKISLKSITKLDKTSLGFKIQIGSENNDFTINLK